MPKNNRKKRGNKAKRSKEVINRKNSNNVAEHSRNPRINKNPIKSDTQKKKNKNKKDRKINPVLVKIFKILIIIFLLCCVIGAGIFAGIFFGLFGDDFEITKEELKIGASNSVIVDKNGAVL